MSDLVRHLRTCADESGYYSDFTAAANIIESQTARIAELEGKLAAAQAESLRLRGDLEAYRALGTSLESYPSRGLSEW